MSATDAKKQIEEMARDICQNRHDHITHECKECALSAICLYKETADVLYRAGYRKQSEGENIGTVHPVDEFKCSVCGITLEGWTRVVTDEDDGELYYYEYEFKYCPNCGAKMKGGASDA